MSKIDGYVDEIGELSDFVPDQTVIIPRKYLSLISSVDYEEEINDLPPVENWYPLVNSYYPFTEDVDAYARVQHLLEHRQSVHSFFSASTQDDISQYDPYSERVTQTKYLVSHPLCFVILGKPGIGEEQLGRRLADYWKCVYIDPQVLLEEEILSESRAGQCIEFNLRCGRSIGVDIILRLLGKKMESPSVMHRGCVVCGFPLIPNDLYEEDPISSESAVFNVKEIFEEIIDNTVDDADKLSKRQVSLVTFPSTLGSIYEPTPPTLSEHTQDDPVHIHMSLEFSFHNEICGNKDIANDFEKQINCLFGLFQVPFMIVYMFCENGDVVLKRDNTFFDIYSKKTVDMLKVRLFNEIGGANEYLSRDLLEFGNSPFADNPNLRHLVKSPENLPSQVRTQLDRYHRTVANLIDTKVIGHNGQYYVKVDGATFLSRMIDSIKMRLKVLPVQKVLLPQRMNVSFTMGGEGAEPVDAATPTLEEAFQKFSRSQVVAPQFKWIWSNWGEFCPVAMRKGKYVRGDANYAVRFLNRIFFLSNDEAYLRFMENPRTYLLPPYPKPGNKVFIFGPPMAGKTAVARCLSYLYNYKILQPNRMFKEFLSQKMQETEEQIRQAAITEALKLLEEQKHDEFLDKMEARRLATETWGIKAMKAIEDLIALLNKGEPSLSEISSFAVKLEKSRTFETPEYTRLHLEFVELNLPFSSEVDFYDEILANPTLLPKYLPDSLKTEIKLEPATVLDPFVLEFANRKVASIDAAELTEMAEQNLYEMYMNVLKECELQNSNGWIVDGMTMDINILTQICEQIVPQEVIILSEPPESTFLLNRVKQGHLHNYYKDFKNFFLKLRNKEAAWRCPSVTSTASYKEKVAEDILSDILKRRVFKDNSEEFEQPILDAYEPRLKEFNEKVKKIQKLFTDLDVKMVNIDVTDLSIEELMLEVINRLRDKYRKVASVFTESDRAEEVQMFLAKQAPGGEGEGAIGGQEDLLSQNRQYGDTYLYCPVAFSKNWVLWKGKEEFAAKFRNKIYLMSSEDAMKKFLKRPREYLHNTKPPDTFPPPRICVVGVKGSGRTTVAKLLAENLGVRYISFEDVLLKTLDTFSTTTLYFDGPHLNKNLDNLPDVFIMNFLEKFTGRLWSEEPLNRIGFVLDGFPEKPRDLEFMIKHLLIPDLIICTSMSREDVLRGQLERAMNAWRERMDGKRKAKEMAQEILRNEWEEQRKSRYGALIEMRRASRYSERISQEVDNAFLNMDDASVEVEGGLVSETQISVDSFLEQQDEEEVLDILNDEFPEPPVFEEDGEDEEEVLQRYNAVFEENYEEGFAFVNTMRDLCKNELIDWVELNGNLGIEKSAIQAYIATDHVKFRNRSLFERCYRVSNEIAEKLLEQGYYFLSRFGKFCPVQCYYGKNHLQMYYASARKMDLRVVLYRQYVYYLASVASYEKFIKDPLKYINVNNICMPLIPIRVAIIGPPKCGKTSVANRFKNDLGFTLVSRGGSVRDTLRNSPLSILSASMEELLRKGKELPDKMVMKSVRAALNCGEDLTHASIFDGFPTSVEEMNLLVTFGLVPHVIFDLQASDAEVYKLATIPIPGKYPMFSQRFIQHLLGEWRKNAASFRLWSDQEFQNIYKVGIERSIWGVWEKCKDVTCAMSFERKHYYMHAHSDWPLRLAYMLVTPLEFIERQSSYKSYCPVCLHHSRALKSGGNPPDRTGLVHFREYFYWICEKHIEEFLRMPEAFIPPNNICLPQELPMRLNLTEMPSNVAENGYCLICYLKNLPKKVLKQGCCEYAVSYVGKIYLFDSEECLNAFLLKPDESFTLTINFKSDVEYGSLSYHQLPVLGMLEQYVSKQIVKAVHHINIHRPIIPGLSIPVSALIGIGLHLKVWNPNTPEQLLPFYKKGLEIYHQRRTDLIKHLDMMKRYLNPYLHYDGPCSSSSSDGDYEFPVNWSDDSHCAALHVIDSILDGISYE